MNKEIPAETLPHYVRTRAKKLALELMETDDEAVLSLGLILAERGEDETATLVKRAKAVYANKTMMTADGSRPRTLGGVFFHLVRRERDVTKVHLKLARCLRRICRLALHIDCQSTVDSDSFHQKLTSSVDAMRPEIRNIMTLAQCRDHSPQRSRSQTERPLDNTFEQIAMLSANACVELYSTADYSSPQFHEQLRLINRAIDSVRVPANKHSNRSRGGPSKRRPAIGRANCSNIDLRKQRKRSGKRISWRLRTSGKSNASKAARRQSDDHLNQTIEVFHEGHWVIPDVVLPMNNSSIQAKLGFLWSQFQKPNWRFKQPKAKKRIKQPRRSGGYGGHSGYGGFGAGGGGGGLVLRAQGQTRKVGSHRS